MRRTALSAQTVVTRWSIIATRHGGRLEAVERKIFGIGLTILLSSTAPGFAQPRTPDGRPDFQGTWNSASLTPLDPVTLGLSSQIDLDLEVQRAAKEKPAPVEAQGATLLPAAVTTAPKEKEEPQAPAASTKKSEDLDVQAVFAKLKQIGGGKSE